MFHLRDLIIHFILDPQSQISFAAEKTISQLLTFDWFDFLVFLSEFFKDVGNHWTALSFCFSIPFLCCLFFFAACKNLNVCHFGVVNYFLDGGLLLSL